MKKNIMLNKKTIQELKKFFDSLVEEKKLAKFDIDLVLRSEFIAIERVGKEIAGVVGVWKIFYIFPTLFIVVKKDYQGKNVGNKLMQKEIEFARYAYNFIILKTFENGKYDAAIHLYKKYGFRVFLKRKSKIWMCNSFNSKGKIICKLLPLFFSLMLYVNPLRPTRIISRILKKNN